MVDDDCSTTVARLISQYVRERTNNLEQSHIVVQLHHQQLIDFERVFSVQETESLKALELPHLLSSRATRAADV